MLNRERNEEAVEWRPLVGLPHGVSNFRGAETWAALTATTVGNHVRDLFVTAMFIECPYCRVRRWLHILRREREVAILVAGDVEAVFFIPDSVVGIATFRGRVAALADLTQLMDVFRPATCVFDPCRDWLAVLPEIMRACRTLDKRQNRGREHDDHGPNKGSHMLCPSALVTKASHF
jgi:hypothetical protein